MMSSFSFFSQVTQYSANSKKYTFVPNIFASGKKCNAPTVREQNKGLKKI